MASTACGYLLGLWGGTLVSWAGMTAACLAGYWLGSRGQPGARRLVGSAEMERVSLAAIRLGPWVVVLFRPVPVLAEASVIFAGLLRMPFRRFLAMAAVSNLGISAVYAAVGAYSLKVESFLLALAGALLAPLLAMIIARLATSRPSADKSGQSKANRRR